MNINELRLGNYVMDIDNDILPVTTDTFYWISECVRNEDDYKPIELTEDILLKCGFISDEITFELNGFMLGWFKNNEFYYLPTNQISYRNKIEIKYLHQLQNLYFAIIGSELNVSKI